MLGSSEVEHQAHTLAVGSSSLPPATIFWSYNMLLRMKENMSTSHREISTSDEDDVPDLEYIMNFFRFVLKNVSCLLQF